MRRREVGRLKVRRVRLIRDEPVERTRVERRFVRARRRRLAKRRGMRGNVPRLWWWSKTQVMREIVTTADPSCSVMKKEKEGGWGGEPGQV